MKVVGAILLALAGYVGGVIVTQGPQCPTEDSCRVDYVHGRYVVTPVVP